MIGDDRSKNEFLFFYGSLLKVFQPSQSQLWAFSVEHGKEALYRYVRQPLYQHSNQALREAKLHALINFCERSYQLHWLTSYPSDRVLVQSEELIGQLGKATNFLVIDLYHDKQARIDFLQRVSLNGQASSFTRLLSLDGQVFDGTVTAQLIQFDEDTAVLLENFEREQ